MVDRSLVYRIPSASWALEFPAEYLRALESHGQLRRLSNEAAGQLYSAAPQNEVVRVDAVTELPTLAANRTGLRLNMPAIGKEREAYFEKGLHCLGFWHTHPEPVPSPSSDDIAMAADHANAGRTVFAGLVFVIVGTAAAPEGIGVWVHDGTSLWRALPELEPAPTLTDTAILRQ
jgi:hypothetical protein